MSNSKDILREGIVSFFFLGRAPVAPGTFGSFGAVILAYLVATYIASFAGFVLLALAAVFYYIGLQLAPWCEEKFDKDPGIFVLDEVIGYLIPIGFLIILSVEVKTSLWILSFIFFRIFDVIKIWPAKDLENISGGNGILLDDVAAGFQTLIVILLIEQLGFLP